MDPKNNGGSSVSDLQRQAAARIAREKVLAAYMGTASRPGSYSAYSETSSRPAPYSLTPEHPTNSYQTGVTSSNPATFQQNTTSRGTVNPFYAAKANQQATTPAHLKDTTIQPDAKNTEAWRNYHSAWQAYYQKYYNSYYSNAARQYIAKARLKDAREQADRGQVDVPNQDETEDTTKTGVNAFLRKLIRHRATDSAKKARGIKRFAPLIAGLAVMLTILFMQYNRMIWAPIMAYVSPGNAPASGIEAVDPTITQTVSADPRLIIPKLNIDVPIRFDVALDDVMAAMNNGVAHYRIPGASAYPGQVGNFVITGHSAGDIYSNNPYKYIFSGLERLEDGDLIYVNYNSVRYTYKVIKKEVIEPTNVAALVVSTNKPLLTLVTCTPVGTSRYRLLVTAEQISPSTTTDATETSEEPQTPVDEPILPSNEPTFFENIWNFLTGQ